MDENCKSILLARVPSLGFSNPHPKWLWLPRNRTPAGWTESIPMFFLIKFVHPSFFFRTSLGLHQALSNMPLIRTFVVTVLTVLVGSFAIAEEESSAGYGLDCSWPIHNLESSCGDLLGDRKSVYDEYMRGCREKWGEKGAPRCAHGDEERITMNRRQPQSMVVSIGGVRTKVVDDAH